MFLKYFYPKLSTFTLLTKRLSQSINNEKNDSHHGILNGIRNATCTRERFYFFNEGEVLTLSVLSGSDYQYIDFPRKKIIIKRGAIANFKSLIGKKLVVSEVNTKPNGSLETILKRKDGLNFFRFFST